MEFMGDDDLGITDLRRESLISVAQLAASRMERLAAAARRQRAGEVAARVMAGVADGHLGERMEGRFGAEYAVLQSAINDSIARLERIIIRAARGHDHHAFALLKSVHGIGDIIGLTLLYEIHEIQRFSSLGGFLSYCRLIKCEKTSNGKKKGTGKRKQGNRHLKWAFSEAAALFLRANPAGQKLHSRLVKKHGKAKALGILAAKLARSVYYMLHLNTPFDMDRFIRA